MLRRHLAMLLVVLPAPLVAQSTRHAVSLLVGFGFQNGEENYGPGLHIGSRFSPYRASRLALRVDLDYAAFGQYGTYVTGTQTALCALPCTPRTGDRIKVLGANAHLAALKSSGFAWAAGIGVYHFFETPYDGQYTRAGWNAGFTTSMQRAFFFDMRYHGLVGPRTNARGYLLLSLGIGL